MRACSLATSSLHYQAMFERIAREWDIAARTSDVLCIGLYVRETGQAAPRLH